MSQNRTDSCPEISTAGYAVEQEKGEKNQAKKQQTNWCYKTRYIRKQPYRELAIFIVMVRRYRLWRNVAS